MKRQRGRSRNNNNNKSGHSGNRSYDSSGPDVKVRGNASQVHEKYVALARDAASSGNRVKAENLRQHAEHYLRLANALEEAKQAARDEADARRQNQNQNQASNDDNESADSSDEKSNTRSRRFPPRAGRGKSDENKQAADGLEVVTPEGSKPAPKPKAKAKPKDKTDETRADASDDAPKPARRRKAPTKAPKSEPSVDAAE